MKDLSAGNHFHARTWLLVFLTLSVSFDCSSNVNEGREGLVYR
jgi:hypothetical protein